MARRGFISALNAVAREAARQQRRIEAERRRQERARLQYQRQMERAQRLKDKEDKQRCIKKTSKNRGEECRGNRTPRSPANRPRIYARS